MVTSQRPSSSAEFKLFKKFKTTREHNWKSVLELSSDALGCVDIGNDGAVQSPLQHVSPSNVVGGGRGSMR
jgi:hypothetical protein